MLENNTLDIINWDFLYLFLSTWNHWKPLRIFQSFSAIINNTKQYFLSGKQACFQNILFQSPEEEKCIFF